MTHRFPYPRSNMKIVVYGMDDCPFCRGIKELLDKNNLKYTYYNINTLIDLKNIKSAAEFKEKLRSRIGEYPFVPVIFLNGKFIGGLREFKRHLPKLRREQKMNEKN